MLCTKNKKIDILFLFNIYENIFYKFCISVTWIIIHKLIFNIIKWKLWQNWMAF
jgi:hypothetical protein